MILAALVGDYVDRRYPDLLSMSQRINLFGRLARTSACAASAHFEPHEMLDPNGVRSLVLIVYSVFGDCWNYELPAVGVTGWAIVFLEATRAWLRAEQGRLEPNQRRALRKIAKGLGWHWDPQRPQGSWYFIGATRRGWPPPFRRVLSSSDVRRWAKPAGFSAHSYGMAIDMDYAKHEKRTRELIESAGFRWGGEWHRSKE